MFLLLTLMICKLYKSKIGPIGKKGLSRHQIGTKFHTLPQIATEILSIMSVHPLDFLAIFHSFLMFLFKLMNIQIIFFSYLHSERVLCLSITLISSLIL